jgi:hypothetical protein
MTGYNVHFFQKNFISALVKSRVCGIVDYITCGALRRMKSHLSTELTLVKLSLFSIRNTPTIQPSPNKVATAKAD